MISVEFQKLNKIPLEEGHEVVVKKKQLFAYSKYEDRKED
ncbi:16330_t:CDS:2 [Cetraspora pellucida]|uniref:16330_t:CDS:1 n=1 Tax=Cetraspora pellucida TaxID=1433469 RepID=A0A9N9BS28_9GLOM|nr:16330_t:CDS:2 [Cetraspora pellucida]